MPSSSHPGHPLRTVCVVGTRPNFVKIAPIVAALRAAPGAEARLVHTGQHYDIEMNQVFFAELGIPRPDVSLGVGSGSHTRQTAAIMQALEPVLEDRPDLVLVVGDVNSTLAATLVAAQQGIPVAHVEAGLRSFDRTMPEEINRVLTDQIATLLFTTERQAARHLEHEGIGAERVHFVGNVMIDSLRQCLARAVPAAATLGRAPGPAGFALLTLHRPANVDDPVVLDRLLDAICEVARRLPVVFPAHPRTAHRLAAGGRQARLEQAGVLCLPPQSYLRILGLQQSARFVMTDSGGIQEETTALGVPCLTLRPTTERPVTVEAGTNLIVDRDPARILAAVDEILATGGKRGRIPELWDGQAAQRIVAILRRWWTNGKVDSPASGI
jgi:UDP-N-acetylglucosamine 2-epimerase (non-hydrolysing)